MNFDQYQKQVKETAEYEKHNIHDVLTYLGLGLSGESGEVANKIKKIVRGDYLLDSFVSEYIAQELGDVLWYLTEISREIGIPLETIAKLNIEKCKRRRKENTIRGDGDNR